MLKTLVVPLSGIVAIIVVVLLTIPVFREAERIRKEEVATAQEEYEKEMEIKDSLDRLKQEYQESSGYLSMLEDAIPAEKQIKSFVIQLEAMLLNEGLNYESISIEDRGEQVNQILTSNNQQASQKGIQTIGVQTQVLGPYENIKNFIRSAEELIRLNNLNSLSIQFESRQGGGEEEEGALVDNLMSASVSFEIYQKPELDASKVKSGFQSYSSQSAESGLDEGGLP
ncbi:MAG: type 4a pilus biogenesis protein PilO [Candidatus Moranbacteria bacterium]|nr:type 4a pilus biogenesis protein PilO [Candidatus Moranbacteria bacterium]